MTMQGRLQVAIIGAGRMGLAYARIVAQHPQAELVALLGNSAAGSEKARRLMPGTPVITGGDLARLWDTVGELQAVIVATPEWAHAQPAIAALERGLHVLVEKPLADNVADGAAIAAAAGRARGIAMVCHSVRFDPRYARARQEIAHGAIGRVLQMTARRDADRIAFARIAKRTDPAFWLAPHDIDIMQWMANSSINAVRAQYERDKCGEPTGLDITLRFASGASGTIESRWGWAPADARPRNCFLEVQGESGAISVEAPEQGLALNRLGAPRAVLDVVYGHDMHGVIGGVDAALVDHFLRCAAQNTTPICTLEVGLSAIRVAAAASQSAASGHEVTIEKEAA